jgi:hypothetical protein
LDRELNSLESAVILLDEWIAAYQDLQRDHALLMRRYLNTRDELKHARAAIEYDLVIDAIKNPPVVSECPF